MTVPTDTFACVPRALLIDRRVTDRDRTLWAYLASRGWRTGEVWASRVALAEALHCSTDSITRAVKRLTAAGWLDVIRRRGVRVLVYLVKGLRRRAQSGDDPGDKPRPQRRPGVRTSAARKTKVPSGPRQMKAHEPVGDTLSAQSVVREVRQMRPDWDPPGIISAWHRASARSGSPARALRALLNVATHARTPALAVLDGWHWA